MTRTFAFSGVVLSAVLACPLVMAEPGPKKVNGAPKALNELSLEVTALQMLRQFQFTFSQLEKVRQYSKDAAEKGRRRQEPRASSEFRETLQELHKALVKGDDDELIEQLSDELDDLRYDENPFLDDDVKLTKEARQGAPELLRLLKANQYAAFTGLLVDLVDPRDILTDALAKARDFRGADWRDKRGKIAREISRLVGGVDAAKEESVNKAVIGLLNRAHKLKGQAFQDQLPQLEKTGLDIIGTIGPSEVIRNEVEYSLAELLANPRLLAVLAGKLQI